MPIGLASDLDRFVRIDQRAIRLYLGFSAAIVLLGVALVVIGFVPSPLTEGKSQELLFKIGGGFVAAMSAFSLREILHRRDRIGSIQIVKDRWLEVNRQTDPSEEEISRLEAIIWNLFEKRALA